MARPDTSTIFHSFVASSTWLGGDKEYSALHEAFPYWFNGIVPLAYSLQDDRLKKQIRSSLDHVLKTQFSDGWIGPESKESGLRNLWARYPFLLGRSGGPRPTHRTRLACFPRSGSSSAWPTACLPATAPACSRNRRTTP